MKGGWRRPNSAPAAALLAVAAIVPFLLSLGGGFVFDDEALVRDNPAVWAATPAPAWTGTYWPGVNNGLYRPLTTTSYWINAHLLGSGPAGFHAVNLLLHAIITILLWLLLLRLFPKSGTAAWVTALVFAVHPIHSEAVVGIVGRAELLAALWALAAYALAVVAARGGGAGWVRVPLSSLLFGLALLSKESAAGLLLLPLFHWSRLSPPEDRTGAARREWRRIVIGWAVVLGLVLLLRIRVLGALVGLEKIGMVDNPLASASAPVRWLAGLGFQWILLWRLLFPWQLSADYSYPELVPSTLWLVAGAVLALLGFVALRVLWKKRDPRWIWGAAFLVASGLLTSNVPFAIGTVLGERLAYLPSAAVLWIGVDLFLRARRRWPGRSAQALLVAGVVWTVGLAVRSEVRCLDWRSNLTLFTQTVKASPRSAKAWTNLAQARLERKQLAEARAAAEEALRLYPDYGSAHLALGSILDQSRQPQDALPHLRRATSAPGKRGAIATLELGNAYLLLGRGAEAESTFHAAERLPDAEPWRVAVGLASALAVQSRWPESRTAWGRAVELAPDNLDVRQRWAFALWMAGAADSAETVYRGLIAARPGDAALENDFAWFLVQTDRDPDEAVRQARDAFRRQPNANFGDTLLESILARDGCASGRAWLDSLRAARPDTVMLQPLEEKLAERCNPDSRG